MSRVGQLEARRLALLARCDQQRFELAYRVRQLTPGALLSRWTRRAPASAANHPLRWMVSLATLIVLLRERRLIVDLARGGVPQVVPATAGAAWRAPLRRDFVTWVCVPAGGGGV
jgi:hypothetical protein